MNIVLVGSGNVATHYAIACYAQGHRILQVYSKTRTHAETLAHVVFAEATNDISTLVQDADLYLIAVSDEAIPQVVGQLSKELSGIIVHTSGATPLSVLDDFAHYGVVYPLQSLSMHVDTDISNVPFAIEASDNSTQAILLKFTKSISAKSFLCTSTQRLSLHIAAVFVNNFPNVLYQVAHKLVEQQNLDFELLRPLILETAQKVQTHLPHDVQTGPAIRNDQQTLHAHLQFLSQYDGLSEIYQELTTLITKSR